jgi:hypothetical protein
MSSDTNASLQAQAQDILTSKGSRPLALFLIGKSVINQCGHPISLLGDSLHLMEGADSLQALIEQNPLNIVDHEDLAIYCEEADRLARPYVQEAMEELREMEAEFRRDMGDIGR